MPPGKHIRKISTLTCKPIVEEHDDIINPLGAKGLGEIGIVGAAAAAIGNVIYHATGKRVRDLPMTIDKLL